MHTEVKQLDKKRFMQEEDQPEEMSVEEASDEGGQDLTPQEFSIELFEQPRLRMNAFIERLGQLAETPASLEKYRSELPAKKPQLIYGTSTVLSIVDNMVRKARTTQKLKRNWSKYDLIVMFWAIEKFALLENRRPNEYNEEDWQYIASLIPGKHRHACLFKWLNLKMNIKTEREPWSQAEGALLLKMVAERKAKGLDQLKCHWSTVSHRLYLEGSTPRIFRTAKQCRQRWGCTNPDVKKDLWSRKEDIQLLKGYLEMGKKWAVISRLLVARTENAVKNRFELLEKKIVNRAKKQSQQPIRLHISKYIQQLEVEDCLNSGSSQAKIEEAVQESCQLGLDPLMGDGLMEHTETLQKTPQIKSSSETVSILSGGLSRELTDEEAKNVRFCRMTEDLLRNTFRKGLVPAVLQQQRIILKSEGTAIPVRQIGWIRCIPPPQFNSHPFPNP